MQPHPIDTYQIGIICALPKELKALRLILDEEHPTLQYKDAQDNNSYILGRVGEHNVVAAGLPAGVYGTTSAISVGKDMLRTFPRLRFGLLVGIGGGIPDPTGEHDVRLGDVVVSQPDTTYGGVVQYDLGKFLHDGTFEPKGSLNKPPLSLLTALSNLQAGLDRDAMAKHLEDVDNRHPLLMKEVYAYPGSRQDLLHCTRCDPSRWWWILWVLVIWLWPLWQCEECNNGLVRRSSRPGIGPVVHYGTIASANALLENAQKRDQLRAEVGALCVEMEAAGLMDNFPCLVIRGICDYADAQKNDVWQEYAALTAAVFAKRLLSYILPQMTEQEEPMINKLDQYLQRLETHHLRQEAHQQRQEAFHQRQETRYQDGQHQDCHRIFKTGDYEGQKNINPHAVQGTCQWVLDHPQYQTWSKSTRDDLLWISADPGCGKSVLSKSLVDVHLRYTSNTRHHTICYFFFKDNEQQNRVSTALCAILHQLFSDQPSLISHALSAFKKNGEKLQRDTNELWRILQAATGDSRALPVICVADALDECRDGDRRQFIDFICQAYHGSRKYSTKRCLKWLVTSRPYDDVRDRFEKIPSHLPSIRLRGEDETELIRDEINLVIRQRVQELSQELRLSITKTEEVLQQLLSMEHRTYLWLYLAVDAIRDSFRDAMRPAEQEVVLVPTTVEEAYERLLSRVTSAQREKAMIVLTIIVGARRPLTIGEMALALDIATLPRTPSTTTDLTIDARQLSDRIRRWCGLFVLISGNRIYLLHQTAKEFLLSYSNEIMPSYGSWKNSLPILEVEKKMAMICVRYLCLSDFNISQTRKDTKQDNRLAIQTFFNFAAEHWANYTQPIEADLEEDIQTNIQALYDSSSERWKRWTSAMWKTAEDRNPFGFDMSSVQLAAFNGHDLLLQNLIKLSPDAVNHHNGYNETGVILAAQRGFPKVIQILLNAGADINTQGGRRGNALQVASKGGHVEVVQILLKAGADVNAHRGFHGNALQMASGGGHVEVVQILLNAGADVNVQDVRYCDCDALQAASKGGHVEVVQILLNAGADVNAQGSIFGNALQRASEEGHVEVVQILLKAGADVNAQGDFYINALQGASGEGHVEIVQILLNAGADVNAQGGIYGNALQPASKGGHVEIVQILLNAGADVDAQSEHDGDALQMASKGGHVEVVQILLKAGADVNAQGGIYSNALQAASVRGCVKIVQILLNAGADVNAQGGFYGNALRGASEGGHVEVVQILLAKGIDVNAESQYYDRLENKMVKGRAIQAASAHGHDKIVQILLDKGAYINAQETDLGGALHMASSGDHDEVEQKPRKMDSDNHA